MKTPAHVLVCRLDNVGDVLLTGPATRAVASSSERVTYLCSSAGAAAAALLPGVDDVIRFDAPWVAYDPPRVVPDEIAALVARILAAHVDRAVIFTSFHQSPLPLALLLRLAGVPEIGAISDDYPGSLLDVRHRIDGPLHEVERALSLAAAFGYALATGDDMRLRLRDAPAAARAFDDPYVVVHPGASVPARGLPLALARDAVDALVAAGWRVAVTGSSSERDATTFVSGASRPAVIDLAGRTELAELAEVLRAAEVVVTGNTGPAHLAAAVGTPVVSLFAPVVAADQWLPWGVPVAVLGEQSVPCAGCRARICPVPGQPCTAEVCAADIVAAVHRLAASEVLR
jgi:ADP-heptose:LPS heptosyltransferase